jgi:hypothetical protein
VSMAEATTKPDGTVAIVRDVLALAQAVYPIPRLMLWAAVILAATIVVIAQRLDVGALLRAWAKATAQDPPNAAPPMPMPEGGMPVPGPGDRWERNEP